MGMFIATTVSSLVIIIVSLVIVLKSPGHFPIANSRSISLSPYYNLLLYYGQRETQDVEKIGHVVFTPLWCCPG